MLKSVVHQCKLLVRSLLLTGRLKELDDRNRLLLTKATVLHLKILSDRVLVAFGQIVCIPEEKRNEYLQQDVAGITALLHRSFDCGGVEPCFPRFSEMTDLCLALECDFLLLFPGFRSSSGFLAVKVCVQGPLIVAIQLATIRAENIEEILEHGQSSDIWTLGRRRDVLRIQYYNRH
jgi:hypothetical protein